MLLQRFLSDLTVEMGNCIQDADIVNEDLVYINIDETEEDYIGFVKKMHELTKQNGRIIADIGGKLQHRDVNFNEISVVKWAMRGIQNDIKTLNNLSRFLNDKLVEAYDEYKKKISEDPKPHEEEVKRTYNLSTIHSIDDITVDSILLTSGTVSDLQSSIKEEDANEYFTKAITEIPDSEDFTRQIEMANNLLSFTEEEPDNTEISQMLEGMDNNGIHANNNNTKSAEGTNDADVVQETIIAHNLSENTSPNYEKDKNDAMEAAKTTTITSTPLAEATNNVDQLTQVDAVNGDDEQMEIDLSRIKKDEEEYENESIYSHKTDIVPNISHLKKDDEFSEILPESCRVLNGDVDTFQMCNDILSNDPENLNNTNDHFLLDSICDDDYLVHDSFSSSSSDYMESDEHVKSELNDFEIDLQRNVDVQPRFYDIVTKPCNVRISKVDTDICQRYIDEQNQKNEIQRLLDLGSLKRKRKSKCRDSSVITSTEHAKKKIELNDRSSSSSSNFSSDDSDLNEYNSDYSLTAEVDLLTMHEQMADAVLDHIKDSESDTSSQSSEDAVVKKKPKHSDAHNLPKRKTQTSEWRKDRLLTCNLNKPKEKVKTNNQADVTDSNIEILTDHQQVEETPETKATVVSNSKGKGRKNIRPVFSYKKLSQSTQIANTEEKERIGRLKMKHTLPGDEDAEIGLRLDDEIVVHPLLSARLKRHQKEGVKFMWNSCYESVEVIKRSEGVGCILAHCMGLGKTFQIITLLHTLFMYQEETRTNHVLILCPISTILNWKNEFNIAFNIVGFENFIVHKISDSERDQSSKINVVNEWIDSKGVLIMGYDCFSALSKQELDMLQEALVNPGPDLVICDEGHLLKNGNATRSKMIKKVKTKRKIILTGTPMQNNLREYYHMVQIVKPNLLGTYREYTNRFVSPIINGQYDNSTEDDIQLMKKRSHVLHKVLKDTVQRVEANELCKYLPPIKDYVLIIPLQDLQRKLYKKAFDVIRLNKERKKLFMHYYQLMMIWTHPLLLRMQEKTTVRARPVEQQEEDDTDEVIVTEELPNGWWQSIVPPVLNLLMYSPKFQILFSIIRECMKVEDKLLVFSSLLVELDAIELFLKEWNIEYQRMDGNVSPDGRERLCSTFQSTKVPVFILSYKVGSLGLNLTAANRVVLMDVSWNPAIDSQSIFRIFRFGQTKPCFVYRLVSKGTMEEVVYERSITKQAIASRVVDDIQISRHYRSEDLLAMYRCNVDPVETPNTVFKKPSDNILAAILQKNKALIHSYLEMDSLLKNRPDEELNEEEMISAWDEYNKDKELNALQSNPSCSKMFNQFIPGNNFNFSCSNMLPLSYSSNNITFMSPPATVSKNNNSSSHIITDGEVIELD